MPGFPPGLSAQPAGEEGVGALPPGTTAPPFMGGDFGSMLALQGQVNPTRINELETAKAEQEKKVTELLDDVKNKESRIQGLLVINNRLTTKLQELMEVNAKATKEAATARASAAAATAAAAAIPSSSRSMTPPAADQSRAASTTHTAAHEHETKELQKKFAENERRLKALKTQNEQSQTLVSELRRSAASHSEKFHEQFSANERLKAELQAQEEKLRDNESYIEQLQLSVTALHEQLQVVRDLKVHEFREAFGNGDLDFEEEAEPAAAASNDKGKSISKKGENMYSALLGGDDEEGESEEEDPNHLDDSVIGTDDPVLLRTRLSIATNTVTTLKKQLEQQQEEYLKSKQAEAAHNETKKSLAQLTKRMDGSNKEVIEARSQANTAKAEANSATAEASNLKKLLNNVSEISELMEAKVVKSIEKLSVELDSIKQLDPAVGCPAVSSQPSQESKRARVLHLNKILAKVLKAVELAKKNVAAEAKAATAAVKASSEAQNEEKLDYKDQVEGLESQVNVLRANLHEVRRALHKSTTSRPVVDSKHMRSKLRENRTAIVQLVKKGIPKKVEGDSATFYTNHVKSLFEPVGLGKMIKSAKLVCSTNNTVLIRTESLDFPALLKKASANRQILESFVVLHLPHWKQLIVHGVHIGRYFYSQDMKLTAEEQAKLRATKRVAIKGDKSIDIVGMCMQLQLLLGHGNIKNMRNTIVGLPRFYNPLEFYSARDKVSLVLCYQSDVLYEGALQNGICMFDSTAMLKTEAVTGPMKNVFSQAGFYAIVENLK